MVNEFNKVNNGNEQSQISFKKVVEVVAAGAIIFLFPLVVYQGVNVFLPEPQSVLDARDQIKQLDDKRSRLDDAINEIEQEIRRLSRKEENLMSAKETLQNKREEDQRIERQIKEKDEERKKLAEGRRSLFEQARDIKDTVVIPWIKHHHRVMFATLLIAGIILIALALFTKVLVLAGCFALSGALSLAIAYVRYWDYLTNVVVFVSLLAALIAMIGALWYYGRRK